MKSFSEIVEQLKQVDASIDSFKDHAVATSEKLDLVLAKIAELKAAGSGATDAQLGELEAIGEELKSSAQAAAEALVDAESKTDAALAEPAPEEPPVE